MDAGFIPGRFHGNGHGVLAMVPIMVPHGDVVVGALGLLVDGVDLDGIR